MRPKSITFIQFTQITFLLLLVRNTGGESTNPELATYLIHIIYVYV